MKPMMGLMLGYVTLGMVRVARKEAERLNPWITYGLVAITIALAVVAAPTMKR